MLHNTLLKSEQLVITWSVVVDPRNVVHAMSISLVNFIGDRTEFESHKSEIYNIACSCAEGMCEPRNRDNGASDLWTLTVYKAQIVTEHLKPRLDSFHGPEHQSYNSACIRFVTN